MGRLRGDPSPSEEARAALVEIADGEAMSEDAISTGAANGARMKLIADPLRNTIDALYVRRAPPMHLLVPTPAPHVTSVAVLVLAACTSFGCNKTAKPDPAPAPVTAEPAREAAAVATATAEPAASPEQVKDISCGADFACALGDRGKVWCWGRNDAGQLGIGARNYEVVRARRPVEKLGKASAIGLGNTHACALLDGGRVACWGANGQGQLGDGQESAGVDGAGYVRRDNDALEAVPVAALPEPVTAIAAGGVHTCVLLASKRVACWPGREARSVPTIVEGLSGVEELSSGGSHVCARLGGGEVTCWHVNDTVVAPKQVSGVCAKQITAGESFACALSCKDDVVCWGAAPHAGRWLAQAARVPLPKGIVEVRAAEEHVCARDDAGRISCWGSNAFGQLGDDVLQKRRPPQAPRVFGAAARRVCTGGEPALMSTDANGQGIYGDLGTTCVISTSGEVHCAGASVDAKRPTLVDLPR